MSTAHLATVTVAFLHRGLLHTCTVHGLDLPPPGEVVAEITERYHDCQVLEVRTTQPGT